MNQLKDAKKKYEEIPIPAELSDRVQAAVQYSENKKKIVRLQRRRILIRRCAGASAAIVVAFTALLNANTTFAQSVSGIPVIGAVAKVLTFRSYEKDEEDLKLSVEIPGVEMISQDMSGVSDAVNQEIYRLCEQYADEAVERAQEYKKAFMDTGGTKEEWAAHNIEIRVWYETKALTADYLSLAVMGSENWNSAHNETKYYNIDLHSGRLVSLKDLLGDDYIQTVNESIKTQMKTRSQETGIQFWTPEEGGFTGISEDTCFYINKSGNPVIMFEKYELAPGSEGAIEFEIER